MSDEQHPLRRAEDRTLQQELTALQGEVDQLQELLTRVRVRASRATRVARGAVSAWAFIATVGLAALAIQAVQNQTAATRARTAATKATTAIERADSATQKADAAASAAVQSRQLATALLTARRQTILQNCNDQNARHAATISTFDRLIGRELARVPSAQRPAIRTERASTTLLLDAAIPHVDCKALVRREGG